MTKARELMTAVLLLMIGAGLAWTCLGRVWLHGVPRALDGHDLSGVDVHTAGPTTVTGRELGVSVGLPLAALAAAGAVLASRRNVRFLVGLLAVVVTAGLLAVDIRAIGRRDSYVPLKTFEHIGESPPAPGVTVWAYLALLGAVFALSGALLVLVRGRGWPALGQRYEAPDASKVAEPVAAQAVGDRGVWDALDRGEDPT
jgi:uncharacterized membrane protein (TIGR02234 family)